MAGSIDVLGESLGGWILGALGALAVLVAGYLAIRAQRKDKLADTVSEHGKDIAHIEGHLETKTNYRPRSK